MAEAKVSCWLIAEANVAPTALVRASSSRSVVMSFVELVSASFSSAVWILEPVNILYAWRCWATNSPKLYL